ncbi:hypothetical protein [Saccharopolyspora griseoalba]|uniref:Uncharacterized protein n=1 Tax=Saccharopolyspora griseoalba TaxID=1431848 RepID=A0ABW2LMN7_9PSEU
MLREYEEALAETDLLGRHSSPADEPEALQQLRARLIEQAEALPAEQLPRPRCGHCEGHREVAAKQVHRDEAAHPQLTIARRLCPNCWGTGLMLRHTQEPPELSG